MRARSRARPDMAAYLNIPRADRYVLRDVSWLTATTETPAAAELARGDATIAHGRIESLGAAGVEPASTPGVAAGGSLLLPCFVDAHAHLDKGHIWPRACNPD